MPVPNKSYDVQIPISRGVWVTVGQVKHMDLMMNMMPPHLSWKIRQNGADGYRIMDGDTEIARNKLDKKVGITGLLS